MLYCSDEACKEKMEMVARKCAEIIQEYGINANDAQSIPELLKEEIERNNWQKLCTEPFKVFPFGP